MFVRVNDINVHVLAEGPAGAPPLVLLHSLGTNGHIWDAQAAVLAHSFRVIRPDLRGHGLTSCTPRTLRAWRCLPVTWRRCWTRLISASAHIGGISHWRHGGAAIRGGPCRRAPPRLILCDTALAIPPVIAVGGTGGDGAGASGMAAIADCGNRPLGDTGLCRTRRRRLGWTAMLLRTPAEGYAAAAEAIAAADLTEADRPAQRTGADPGGRRRTRRRRWPRPRLCSGPSRQRDPDRDPRCRAYPDRRAAGGGDEGDQRTFCRRRSPIFMRRG